ncbi:MAG: LemA family protein [Chitinophagales bacterium]
MIFGIFGFIFLLAIVFMFMYNGLVRKKNAVSNAFASIDVMLKKRLDLIPNLIETVKAYMKHERELLTEVTKLRSQAMKPDISPEQKIALEGKISSGMRGIMVAVENYPDIKANQNFLELQGSFNEVEEQISASRRAYNAAVNDYNNSVEMFPSNILAGMIGYKVKDFFEIPEEERKNISAKDLFAS